MTPRSAGQGFDLMDPGIAGVHQVRSALRDGLELTRRLHLGQHRRIPCVATPEFGEMGTLCPYGYSSARVFREERQDLGAALLRILNVRVVGRVLYSGELTIRDSPMQLHRHAPHVLGGALTRHD